jgi:3-methyladenine DNA glycosylase AlkD
VRTPDESGEWLSRFHEAIGQGDVGAALSVLGERSTAHAGTPPAADKRRAGRAMLAAVPEPRARWELAERLAASPEPVAVELVCDLIVVCYPHQPGEALRLLHGIADHSNWEVREVAAEALGALLTRHWEELYPVCAAWRGEPSANVRRAVVLAAKFAGRARRPSWGEPLLELLAPLLADRAPYVRKNLGPFALGSGLLRAYPAQALARLRAWAADPDEAVRWNVAMAFSAAEGAKHLDDALAILAGIAADERPFVRGAVRSALRALRKRKPAAVDAALIARGQGELASLAGVMADRRSVGGTLRT